MLGKLVPHQGQGGHIAAAVHQDSGRPTNQFHIARILIRRIDQMVQRIVQTAFPDEQVGIGDLRFHILRIQQDHLRQGIFRSIQVTADVGFLIGPLKNLIDIGRNTRIMRIYLVQTT